MLHHRRCHPASASCHPTVEREDRVTGSLVLAIESSCDETGIAVIEDGRLIRSNVVASQIALHAPAGGIVPELAARAHLRWIVPVLDEAWADAGVAWPDVSAIAVTYGPGLAGSLLVGINFAKALAWVHDLPLVGVNHLEGHVYAAWLRDPGEADRDDPTFPLIALVVSGGHTFLAEMSDHLTYRLLGTTVDDAAGEAFDKVGRLLGLGYPGGPAIGRAAEGATARDRVFPRAWLGDSFDLSFSGLKTAARRIVTETRADAGLADMPEVPMPEALVAELAWGFQDAVVDVLVVKTIRAARQTGARSIVLGGGVAANTALRGRLAGEAEALGIPLVVPRPALCTDNGAMIGAAGARRFDAGERAGLDLDARPSLPLAIRASAV
jgi:N6-L-threonylcarbamoyladenine synthase